MCVDNNQTGLLLSADQWEKIFIDAAAMGITFNLLSGGEPLLRKDVISAAARVKQMIFPVFTNGTCVDESYIGFFAQNRHIIPIFSLEGGNHETDMRRGEGVYAKVIKTMERLQTENVLFGISITVTSQNLNKVIATDFIKSIHDKGCRLIIYVQYVPIETIYHLALSEQEIDYFDKQMKILRSQNSDMIYIAFPGDEKYMGGCLAAGRGFLHINPRGDAEACPFSPYSDSNLTHISLREVLNSPFFMRLRDAKLVGGEHSGGCTLFEQEEKVKAMLHS
jgi:MoaA/NifB/PqqE/SkfB family radical SAM enzyme